MIVIGGGDTGTDCIGTSLRHGCRSLVNFELLPRPPAERARRQSLAPVAADLPRRLRPRGGRSTRFGNDPREYCILSKEFLDDGNGHVAGIRTVEVDWEQG